MQVELVVLISVACTIIGASIGLITFHRNRDKDVKQEAREKEKVNIKLNHIISGVDEVKFDMKANEKQMKELSEQIIRLDESAKSAHKRIDKIENKI